MKGLLLKEFYNIRMVFIFYILIVIFIAFIGLGTDIKGSFGEDEIPTIEEIQKTGILTLLPVIFISGFYPGNMLVSSFGFDEKAHWTPFILSVGVKKPKILLSKVILHFFMVLILCIPFFISLFIVDADFDLNIYVGLILTFFSSCLISGSTSLLICIVVGSNKGVVIGSIISIFTSALPLLFIAVPLVDPMMMSQIWLFSLIGFLICGVGLYLLCYFLSLYIFKKREY